MAGRFLSEFSGRPRLLLAYADGAYASECGRYFRRLGWEVEMVASGAEARALADEYRPNVVVLDEALLEPASWGNVAASAEVRLIVVTDEPHEPRNNVPCVSRTGGAEALANAVLGKPSLSEAV